MRKILNINFITVSHFTKNNLINNFKIEKIKIKVLWNQIFDKDILDLSNRNSNTIDNSIYDPYILIVSTLLKRKNINLIEKISYIYGKKIKFVCPIPNKSKLIRKLAILKKNNVFVYHNISYASLKRLYLNSSCVLIPSIYEGLSLIPLEAISMSKPIIMSKIKPHLYWQLPDEFYFDIGNNKKLLNKLNFYLNQPNTLIDYSTFHKFSNKFYSAQKERNESLNLIYEKDNF